MIKDRRRVVWREDLAAVSLEGQVEAVRFGQGWRRRIGAEVLDIRGAPSSQAPLLTQALYGEDVMIYEEKRQEEGIWAWGQLMRDSYVGYMEAKWLYQTPASPTHKVSVPRTFVYSAPSLKSSVRRALPLESQVTVVKTENNFVGLKEGGFVFEDHVTPQDIFAQDFVTVAEMFLHVPYLWGGKTSLGLDCSGLVQIALQAAGFSCPRDSDMMVEEVGERQSPHKKDYQRGDLIFWPGHVGLMQDSTTLLHANASHMFVASEPLEQACQRILAQTGQALLTACRLKRRSFLGS